MANQNELYQSQTRENHQIAGASYKQIDTCDLFINGGIQNSGLIKLDQNKSVDTSIDEGK